jgi:hypothetical protein
MWQRIGYPQCRIPSKNVLPNCEAYRSGLSGGKPGVISKIVMLLYGYVQYRVPDMTLGGLFVWTLENLCTVTGNRISLRARFLRLGLRRSEVLALGTNAGCECRSLGGVSGARGPSLHRDERSFGEIHAKKIKKAVMIAATIRKGAVVLFGNAAHIAILITHGGESLSLLVTARPHCRSVKRDEMAWTCQYKKLLVTLPFTDEEMEKILWAADTRQAHPKMPEGNGAEA